MTVLVLGCDGYTGYPLYKQLLEHSHEDVVGVDHLEARDYRGQSVIPIDPPTERYPLGAFIKADITDYDRLKTILEEYAPSTIINLAQIPSAPHSMRNPTAAWTTQQNNIRGSLNLYWAIHELNLYTHVIQLATMGEYGVGNDIPEGFLEDGRPAPKEPGSIYHASKVATTTNTLFLSRLWNIPTTEIYQGIVYGATTDRGWLTRFDVDSHWGTVLNRFTAQAATNHPLTVYGGGGQKRAMLSLTDCIQCLTLAIDNPPTPYGRYPYRAINQFDDAYRVRELAELVADYTDVEIEHVQNPRVEDDTDHQYDPERVVLDELGYEPARSIEAEIERTYDIVEAHADRIDIKGLRPTTRWNK